MRKIILASVLLSSILMAEVNVEKEGNEYIITVKQNNLTRADEKILTYESDVKSVIPYIGMVDYSNASEKSSSKLGGVYASVGNLSYLLEVNYGYITTDYKDTNTKNLKQHDISLLYSKYHSDYMLKAGLHHTNTNDTDLGDGNTLILAIGGYKFKDYDKYSYGLEGFYTSYKKSTSLIQVTPYVNYYNYIDANNKNSIDFRINHIMTSDYDQKSYTSYEISDTYYYKNLFATLNAYFGEMKTGVKDSGMTVFNTKDLMKNGYSIRVGYYLKSNLILSGSFGVNNFEEYGSTEDAKSTSSLLSLSYTY